MTITSPAPAAGRSRLGRFGQFSGKHPWAVMGVWLLVLIASAMLYGQFAAQQTAVSYSVDGSESQRVEQLLRSEFPTLGTERDVVVFHSVRLTVDHPAYQQAMGKVLKDFRATSQVRGVVPATGPGGTGQVSQDGRTAVSFVNFGGSQGDIQDRANELQNIAAGTGDPQIEGYLVGYSPISAAVLDAEGDSAERAELIGIPIALLILLLATGSVVAAVIPLLLAATGVLLAFGILGVASFATTMDGILSTVVPMIGLGVGIDYALFITTRFRRELAARSSSPSRADVLHAITVAIGRTGRTIWYSGIVVMLSLLTLLLLDASTFRQLGLGTAVAVGSALVACLTLLPAVLCLLGRRVNSMRLPWRKRPANQSEVDGSGPFAGLARRIMRHPVVVGLTAVITLVVLALPMFGLRLGTDLGTSALEDTRVGTGQQILTQKFTQGAVMPIEAIYRADGKLTERDFGVIGRFAQAAQADPDVAAVSSPAGLPTGPVRDSFISQDGRLASITIVPSVAPDGIPATELVRQLRDQGGPGFLIGGTTAQFVDMSDETNDKMWLIIGLVLVLSLLFLTVVFRSILLPLKAIVMNLLATGAAYGLLVWVFQQGHLESVFDFQASGTIQVYLPLVAFALLFGLSMDYEVFLVRQIQEVWRTTGDNEQAVASGLQRTAGPITAAAAIMVAIFGSFITADILEMKQIGFALAAAILIDATLVRIVLVPAAMRVAGRANWWFPRFLSRRLPPMQDE